MTASMAWPNFHREMEERSKIRWQHRLKREHPTCTERSKSLIEECGWKGGDRVGLGAEQEREQRPKIPKRLLPFLPDGMVTDRSSPSRVRCAAKNAPLTAPGRSEHPPVMKERENFRKDKSKST